MRASGAPTRAGIAWVAFQMGVAAPLFIVSPAPASAQAIYQCESVDGTTEFTENECPPTQKQRMLPPPAAELHPDVQAICTPASRKDPKRDAACRLMFSCRLDDRSNCHVYCSEWYQPAVPELRFGLTSPTCLRLTGHKRGENWVQAGKRAKLSGGFTEEVFIFRCVDARGALFPPPVQALRCLRGSSDCARYGEHAEKLEPLEKLASDVCRQKYGNQLAPPQARQ